MNFESRSVVISSIFLVFIIVIANNFSFQNRIEVTPDDEGNHISNVTYVVSVEEEKYFIKTITGSVVAENLDFSIMMNGLNKELIPGDVILIKNGVYTLYNQYRIMDRDNITIRGESRDGVIIKADKTLNETAFMLSDLNGEYHPANCVVENITFDSNFNPNYFEFVVIGGRNNTIQYCKFFNVVQYCLVTFGATDFKILNNHIYTAQYGITTAARKDQIWSSNGIISGNVVNDCRDCGFKIKWTKNTIIVNNTIDVTYRTWMFNGEGLLYDNCVGISLYHADGPTQNVTVIDNKIYDESNELSETIGINIDKDNLENQGLSYSISEGSEIRGNTVDSCNYGILSSLPGVIIEENVIQNIRYGLVIGGIGIDLRGSDNSYIINNFLNGTGISIGGSNSCTIEKNIILGGMTYWRFKGDGIAVWNSEGLNSDNCLILNNLITQCDGYGIHIYTAPEVGVSVKNTIIDNNIFENCIKGRIYDDGLNTQIK